MDSEGCRFLIISIMETVSLLFQFLVPLGIFNVWLIRPRKSTAYRGGAAASLKEEFAVYGLPETVFYVVGVLKLTAAILLLVGFAFPVFVFPGAVLMSVLMLGAVVMHAKVKDSLIRYVPAGAMLLMSLVLLF